MKLPKNFKINHSLKKNNSLKLNYASDYFVSCNSEKDLFLIYDFLEEKKRNAFVKAADVLINAFNGIKDIKMSQSENHFFGKFQFVSTEASKAEAEKQQWAILPKLIIETLSKSSLMILPS